MATKTDNRLNAMASLAQTKLADMDVEVTNWYNNHAKVEAEDEDTAMDAYNAMMPDDIELVVMDQFAREWKSRSSFVLKRGERDW
jgi:hypothetical protein